MAIRVKRRIRLTEGDLHGIVSESVKMVIREMQEANNNLETWYRGYDSRYGSKRNHLLWFTDDISYAKTYGNRVEEVVLDERKLNPASICDIDYILGGEFDYYDGLTPEEVNEVSSNGYNCYYFHAGDESYCLCLWDDSAIVSRRELSKEEYDSIETFD